VSGPTILQDRQQGFTLLELLIALVIFSLLSVMAYQSLRDILQASEMADQRLQQLAELQKTVLFLSRDIQQLVNRPIRDGLGDPQPALVGQQMANPYQLEFTRAGWANPLGQTRSQLQRVAYSVAEGKLTRWHWRVLDRAQDSQPVETEMLQGVDDMTLEFIVDDSDEPLSEWPGFDPQTGEPRSGLPKAIRITLEIKGWGTLWRLYPVVAG